MISIVTYDSKLSDDSSQIILTFDEALNVTTTQLQQSISIEIISMDEDQYKWNVSQAILTKKAINQTSGLHDEYIIKMTYYDNFYYKRLVLRFIAPYSICDKYHIKYLNDTYQVRTMKIGPYIQVQEIAIIGLKFILFYTVIIFVIAFIVFVIFEIIHKQLDIFGLGHTLNLFWFLVDSFQLFNLLLYINAQLSYQVNNELFALSFSNLNFNNISTIFDIDSQKQLNNQNTFQYYLDHQLYENTLYQSLLLALSIIITIVSLFILKPIPGIQVYFINKNKIKQGLIKESIEYSMLLRITSLIICSIAFSTSIAIKYFIFDSIYDIISFSLMIFYILWIIGYFIITFYVLNRKHDQQSKKFKLDKYTVLFDGIQTKAIFKRNIKILFDLRKVLFAVIIVFQYDYPCNCITILVVIQIVYVMILATKFPFRIQAVNIAITITEIMIVTLLNLIAVVIYLDYFSEEYLQYETRSILGWTTTILIVLVYTFRSFFILLEFYQIKTTGYKAGGVTIRSILDDKEEDSHQQIELVQQSQEIHQ